MELPDVYKYGEGIPMGKMSVEKRKKIKANKFGEFRTDFSQTMEPWRGTRTYPSVKIIEGSQN